MVPPPVAAWCCSCWFPGPEGDSASVGSRPRPGSHPGSCSAARPRAHPSLPAHTKVRVTLPHVNLKGRIFFVTHNAVLYVLHVLLHLLHLTLQLLRRLHNLRLQTGDVFFQVGDFHLHLSLVTHKHTPVNGMRAYRQTPDVLVSRTSF